MVGLEERVRALLEAGGEDAGRDAATEVIRVIVSPSLSVVTV